jgi:hypothetical protein
MRKLLVKDPVVSEAEAGGDASLVLEAVPPLWEIRS